MSRASGDFDADGRRDRFLVYDPTKGPEEDVPDEPGTTADFGPWRIRMELASGAITDEPFSAWGGGHLFGATDVNGDGRDEVLIQTGGVTATIGQVVTLVDCRVTEVNEEGEFPFEFGFFAHSMALGSLGFECLNADDDEAQEAVETDALPDIDEDGKGDYRDADYVARGYDKKSPTRTQWIWSVEIYELRGATMVLEKKLDGRTGSVRPSQFRFGNDVSCGDLTPF